MLTAGTRITTQEVDILTKAVQCPFSSTNRSVGMVWIALNLPDTRHNPATPTPLLSFPLPSEPPGSPPPVLLKLPAQPSRGVLIVCSSTRFKGGAKDRPPRTDFNIDLVVDPGKPHISVPYYDVFHSVTDSFCTKRAAGVSNSFSPLPCPKSKRQSTGATVT
jgi:hypothetical protein